MGLHRPASRALGASQALAGFSVCGFFFPSDRQAYRTKPCLPIARCSKTPELAPPETGDWLCRPHHIVEKGTTNERGRTPVAVRPTSLQHDQTGHLEEKVKSRWRDMEEHSFVPRPYDNHEQDFLSHIPPWQAVNSQDRSIESK